MERRGEREIERGSDYAIERRKFIISDGKNQDS
jgi:hypothetical protein